MSATSCQVQIVKFLKLVLNYVATWRSLASTNPQSDNIGRGGGMLFALQTPLLFHAGNFYRVHTCTKGSEL